MRRMLALLILTLASGCGALNEKYVEADRATYEAIGARYKAYVDADETLTDLQKRSRKNTVDSWDARVSSAEDFLRQQTPDEAAQGKELWSGWERVWYGVRRRED